jgi:hypothetical protein
MSANATAAATATTVTYGRWLETAGSATSSNVGTTATFGPISTINVAATANDNTALTFGLQAVPATTTAATIRNTTAKVGAILQVGTNATSTNAALAITFGPYATLDIAATASGSPALSFGGYHTTDAAATATGLDQTMSFGGQVTMSALATASNDNVSGRFFPYGAGDGATTFGIGLDLAGRVLGVAGSGAGLTARGVGANVGVENVTLNAAQTGVPAHAHADTIGINDPGHNHGGAVGGHSAWRYLPGTDTAGRIQTSYTAGFYPAEAPASLTIPSGVSGVSKTGGVTDHAGTPASQATPLVQPSAFAAKALAIYAGAA